MLNELNKNHMGGFENYGNEELYIEDTWDDVKPDFKPKVSIFVLVILLIYLCKKHS